MTRNAPRQFPVYDGVSVHSNEASTEAGICSCTLCLLFAVTAPVWRMHVSLCKVFCLAVKHCPAQDLHAEWTLKRPRATRNTSPHAWRSITQCTRVGLGHWHLTTSQRHGVPALRQAAHNLVTHAYNPTLSARLLRAYARHFVRSSRVGITCKIFTSPSSGYTPRIRSMHPLQSDPTSPAGLTNTPCHG